MLSVVKNCGVLKSNFSHHNQKARGCVCVCLLQEVLSDIVVYYMYYNVFCSVRIIHYM